MQFTFLRGGYVSLGISLLLLLLKAHGDWPRGYMVLVGDRGSFGATAAWWMWADATGYTKRKAVERMEKRKQDRINKNKGSPMAGARSLWRATGMKDDDFSKPIIAVVNSFTQFVPGHVHLKDLGQLVAREIEAAGGVAKEFNTIAVDDGIAMGHDGMLYSLPSRDIIADSVEYMVNAHCADAMVCISNCDKITPGMLMAAMRLNIPVVFVPAAHGGRQGQAGRGKHKRSNSAKLDLIDAMVMAADDKVRMPMWPRSSVLPARPAVPARHVHRQPMNCLTEALGLSLPGNGTVVATHADREPVQARWPPSWSFASATTKKTTPPCCRAPWASRPLRTP